MLTLIYFITVVALLDNESILKKNDFKKIK